MSSVFFLFFLFPVHSHYPESANLIRETRKKLRDYRARDLTVIQGLTMRFLIPRGKHWVFVLQSLEETVSSLFCIRALIISEREFIVGGP